MCPEEAICSSGSMTLRNVFLLLALLFGAHQASAQVLSANSYSTCALTRTGGVECWGTGILGNGTIERRFFIPTGIETLASGVAAVSNGEAFGCALTVEGRVFCWGENRGRIGNGQTTENALRPVFVEALGTNVRWLTSGINHSCVVTGTGGVKCWGVGQYGRLGNGTTSLASTPVDVVGLERGTRSVSAGDWHTCAVKNDGSVWCWGRNHLGQLGRGGGDSPQPVLVPMFESMREVQSAGEYTCALSEDDAVFCWGAYWGSVPTPVDIPGPVVGLSAGIQKTCAVTLSGEAYCWGAGVAPARVADLPPAASISAARNHTCALLRSGATVCWGENFLGQLGNASSTQRLGVPTLIEEAASGVVDLVLGGWSEGVGVVESSVHFCFTQGASTWCAGRGDRGQLGYGRGSDNDILTPASPLPSDVVQVQAGFSHTCSRTASQDVYCWGAANSVGVNATQDAHRPVRVLSLDGQALGLTAGWFHSCAIGFNRVVQCWGANDYGELGDGTKTRRSTPMLVADLSDVREVSAGFGFTCALTNAGGVTCWGRNESGQVGDNSGVERTLPTEVTGLTDGVVKIDAGISHACAITATGEVRCWGRNSSGQIGDGTQVNRASPRLVRSLTGQAVDVAAGLEHTCALMSDNQVFCWGGNSRGQLGDGTARVISLPVKVRNAPEGIVALRAGPVATCAITQTGAAYCWGQNPVLSRWPSSWEATPQQVLDAVDGRGRATAGSTLSASTPQVFALPGAVPVGSLTWTPGSGTLPDSARMVVRPRQTPAPQGVWRTWEARVDGGAPGWTARLRLHYESNEVQAGTDETTLRLFRSSDRFASARELAIVARDTAANWVEAQVSAGEVAPGSWTSFHLAPSWNTGVARGPVSSGVTSVQVWPNPARSTAQIEIRLPVAQRVQVAVYDLMGRRQMVLHDGESAVDLELTLDTSVLPNGVYVAVVTGIGVRVSRLFTVLR